MFGILFPFYNTIIVLFNLILFCRITTLIIQRPRVLFRRRQHEIVPVSYLNDLVDGLILCVGVVTVVALPPRDVQIYFRAVDVDAGLKAFGALAGAVDASLAHVIAASKR